MAYETITIERDGAIAVVSLNRPDAANAINSRIRGELPAALAEVAADGATRVILLTGAGGRHFCAGADLKESQNPEAAGGPDGQAMCDAVAATPLPVIAVINGACMGGGCEIALACDFRFMAEEARIGLPEIQFGALPAFGGTQRLPRIVGATRAKEMIFTGRHLTASEALAFGLVDTVAPRDALLDTARTFAETLSQRAPYALRTAKFLVDAASEVDLARGLTVEARSVATMATEEERAAARREAAQRDPTYAKIFGDA